MASVSKRQWTDTDGKVRSAFVVRYVDSEAIGRDGTPGRHCQKTFDLKRDADAFKRQIEREIDLGVKVGGATKATVLEVCNIHLRKMEDRVNDKRVGLEYFRTVRSMVNTSIGPYLGRVLFSDLTSAQVGDFYSWMLRRGINARVARDRIYQLKLIEALAIRRGASKRAVVPEALTELRGIPPARIRTFSLDEVRTLLKHAPDRQFKCKRRSHAYGVCAVYLAAFCGLRYGEIQGLTGENVDLDKRTIRVRHSLTRDDELKTPKTASGIRDVPMPPIVFEALKGWFAEHYRANERGLLFRTLPGGCITGSEFHSSFWKPLLGRAGLCVDGREDLHFHALRHFAASWWIENGVSMPDVADMMGHKRFDMTLQVYAHPVIRGTHRHDAMNRMAGDLIGQPVLALPAPAPAL